MAEGVGKRFGDRRLFRDLKLTLSPGMRLGLLGPNGSGKTTLLKILQGELEPDEGGIERAEGLRVVRFEQHRTAQLDPDEPAPRAGAGGRFGGLRERAIHVAGWAKRFLFRAEQLEMPWSRLSGGEQARVLIARLMLQPADLLVLDEPTNDLDIPTLEVLEESLLEFPGALVLVTHDRYLLDRVSTVVIGLDGDGDAGVFADYSQWEAARNTRPEAKSTDGKSSPDGNGANESATREPAGLKKKLSYLEQREWDSMERQILESEQELARWEREVQQAASDVERLPGAYAKLQQAHARVEELYARWAELESKVAG